MRILSQRASSLKNVNQLTCALHYTMQIMMKAAPSTSGLEEDAVDSKPLLEEDQKNGTISSLSLPNRFSLAMDCPFPPLLNGSFYFHGEPT